jgi:hypothetical protein
MFQYHYTISSKSHRTFRFENLYEVRMIPTKKDIAFVEYGDEASATIAKEALHNYKLDGEVKMKVCALPYSFVMAIC